MTQGSSPLPMGPAKGLAAVGTGMAVSVGSSLLVTLAAIHYLPDAGAAGTYLTVFTTVIVVSAVLRLGLDQNAVRMLAGNTPGPGRRTSVTRTSSAILAAVCILVGVITAVGGTRAFLDGVLHLPLGFGNSVWIGLWLLCDCCRLVFSESLRGVGRTYGATVLGDAGRFLLLAVVCVALGAGHVRTTQAFIEASALTSLAVALVAAMWMALTVGPGDGGKVRMGPVVGGTFPIYLAAVFAIAATQVGVIVVGGALPHTSAALYAAASRISLLLLLPLSVVNLLISPVVARTSGCSDRSQLEAQIRLLTTGATAASVLGYGALAAGLPAFLSVFLPHRYSGVYALVLVLGIGAVSTVVTGPNGLVLVMTGHARMTAIVVGTATSVQILAMVLCAETVGLYGVAVAFSAVLVVQNLVLTFYAKRLVGVWTPMLVRRRAITGSWVMARS